MEKINVAQLLKDCPKGMELYSPWCGDCKLYDVNDYGIRIEIPNKDTLVSLYHDGRYRVGGEIMLFPKGKTTWEGFVPPRKFKDGDVVAAENRANVPSQLFLLKHVKYREDDNDYDGYCYFGWDFLDNRLFGEGNWGFNRLATEEERQILFQAIEEHGYKWNEETKTLEKLKFKVGDKIVHKIHKDDPFVITEITEQSYKGGTQYEILIEQQDNFELAPDKFNINTLTPFESRVLVRDTNSQDWTGSFYSHYNIKDQYPFYCINYGKFKQCIPYEGNEHLLGKTNDCSDFYKTWE